MNDYNSRGGNGGDGANIELPSTALASSELIMMSMMLIVIVMTADGVDADDRGQADEVKSSELANERLNFSLAERVDRMKMSSQVG